MALPVSEHHLLFQLPLNASQDVDRLIFFHMQTPIYSHGNWLLNNVLKNASESENATRHNETYIYEVATDEYHETIQ